MFFEKAKNSRLKIMNLRTYMQTNLFVICVCLVPRFYEKTFLVLSYTKLEIPNCLKVYLD